MRNICEMTTKATSNKIKSKKKTAIDELGLKKHLPISTTSEIYKKLKGKVSKRLIQMVINGTASDYHNIIPKAILIAKREKEKKELLNKHIKQLAA